METAILLGAPLSDLEALTSCLETLCSELALDLIRLANIPKHDALILLRCSLSSPKLMHTLQCGHCSGHRLPDHYDSLLRNGLGSILNLSLMKDQLMQVSLPVKAGGLGICRVSSLALPAFLAFAASTLAFQSSMLSTLNIDTDAQFADSLEQWCLKCTASHPDGELSHKQSFWDKPVIAEAVTELNQLHTSEYHQARLKAVSAPHAGDCSLCQ